METKNIQSKFSSIYKIANFLYWAYIIFAIAVIFFAPFVIMTDIVSMNDVWQIIENKNFLQNSIIGIFIAWWIILFFFCNMYILHLLRVITCNFKNWEIFTQENAKKIKTLFFIFGCYFLFTWLVFTGGMVFLLGLLFVWVLYEIFFIGFDYKKQKDKLEEENNLII